MSALMSIISALLIFGVVTAFQHGIWIGFLALVGAIVVTALQVYCITHLDEADPGDMEGY